MQQNAPDHSLRRTSEARTPEGGWRIGSCRQRLSLAFTGFLAGSAFIHAARVSATSCADSTTHHYYFQFIRAETADGAVSAENPSDLPDDLEVVGGPDPGSVSIDDNDRNILVFEVQE